jgi:hypothetical protein
MQNLKEWPVRTFQNNILVTKINSFEQLNMVMVDKIFDNKNNYIFRGHRKSEWSLKPGVFRDSKENIIDF